MSFRYLSVFPVICLSFVFSAANLGCAEEATMSSEEPRIEDREGGAPAAELPAPEDQVAPEPDIAAGSVAQETPDAALEACASEKDKLLDLLSEALAARLQCDESRDKKIQNAIAVCEADRKKLEGAHDVDAANNRALLSQLQVCKDEGSDEEVRALRQNLKVAISDRNRKDAEIARLREELKKALDGGVTPVPPAPPEPKPEPGYSYAGGAPDSSFLPLQAITMHTGEGPLLEATQCEEALDWLDQRSGDDEPFRLDIWVWRNGSPMLCKRTKEGIEIDPYPNRNDEAHLLYFR